MNKKKMFKKLTGEDPEDIFGGDWENYIQEWYDFKDYAEDVPEIESAT